MPNAKRQHRPVTGLLLIVLALFWALGRRCGVAGEILSTCSVYLFGRTGTNILVAFVLVAALLCLVPSGAVGRIVREWARSRRARPIVARAVAPRLVEARVIPIREKVTSASQETISMVKAMTAKLPTPGNILDTEAALLALGYKPFEFRDIVQGLDAKKPVQTLIREALALLQKTKTG
jgi:hypothetical protein